MHDTILQHYLDAALWSSTSDSGMTFLNDNYDIDMVSIEFKTESLDDIKDFIECAGELLNNIDPAQIGHDFWLTRNGHGAGFWDRGLGDIGDKLTELCKPYGDVNLYVHNGFIHGQ